MQTELIDAKTGEITIIPWTPEQIAAAQAELRARSIPKVITPRQCRLLLLQQGLLQQVEEMIAQSTDDVRITWEYALEFRRDDPILNTFASNLVPPLTEEQIDQFFIRAAKL